METTKEYQVKYRNYWGGGVGYSRVDARSSQDAKKQVSKWGFVLKCDEVGKETKY